MKAIDLVDAKTSRVAETPKPTSGKNEILVKVSYSALDTALDEVAERRTFFGSFLHDLKVEPLVPGYHYSGKVESIGVGTSNFSVGDAVFGHLQYASGQKQGSCSEYVTVPATEVAKVPPGVALDVAAASTTECMTALQALRDNAGLEAGQNVLIIGASGGVGTAAVYIAKALGARQTDAVCSGRDVDRVRSMGADRVIDRTAVDITKDLQDDSYHVVFDVSSKYSFGQLAKLVKPGGTVVNAIPNAWGSLFGWWWYPALFSKTFTTVNCYSKTADLELVGKWIADGQLKVPIDSVHAVSKFSQAWEHQRDTKKVGRVVLKVQDGW